MCAINGSYDTLNEKRKIKYQEVQTQIIIIVNSSYFHLKRFSTSI